MFAQILRLTPSLCVFNPVAVTSPDATLTESCRMLRSSRLCMFIDSEVFREGTIPFLFCQSARHAFQLTTSRIKWKDRQKSLRRVLNSFLWKFHSFCFMRELAKCISNLLVQCKKKVLTDNSKICTLFQIFV